MTPHRVVLRFQIAHKFDRLPVRAWRTGQEVQFLAELLQLLAVWMVLADCRYQEPQHQPQ